MIKTQSTPSRPLVTVHDPTTGKPTGQIKLPAVFLSPIRPDIVHFVHTNMAKNSRQPYSVKHQHGPSGVVAGHQTSAESWGTGRAVSRIPRVKGGGTHRSGQGAFGNMCRGGRMFAPTKIWRKWHRKINKKQKRFAVASALAASALPSLVMARGHRIQSIPELPLVVSITPDTITKTKQALSALKTLGAFADVSKAKHSKKLRPGIGKIRNRRFKVRLGPLLVFHSEDGNINKAFRNLPGIDCCNVERLNLLQLAPGAHLGRFVIWTKKAFEWLEKSSEAVLVRNAAFGGDLVRIVNSDEVQSRVRAKMVKERTFRRKRNPLKNLDVMIKLNPYALKMRRNELLLQEARKKKREDILEKKRALE